VHKDIIKAVIGWLCVKQHSSQSGEFFKWVISAREVITGVFLFPSCTLIAQDVVDRETRDLDGDISGLNPVMGINYSKSSLTIYNYFFNYLVVFELSS